jgi:hypothetical protein
MITVESLRLSNAEWRVDHAPHSLPARLWGSHIAGLYSGDALVAVLRGSTASVVVLPITKKELWAVDRAEI